MSEYYNTIQCSVSICMYSVLRTPYPHMRPGGRDMAALIIYEGGRRLDLWADAQISTSRLFAEGGRGCPLHCPPTGPAAGLPLCLVHAVGVVQVLCCLTARRCWIFAR